MNKLLKKMLSAAVCGIVLLTGCNRETDESSTPTEIVVSGVDSSEPERLPFPANSCGVTLEKAVEKVVSLSPAATEIICELGFGKSLVGISNYCDYPEGLTAEKVGSPENPDMERILELKPEAVFTLSPLSEREAYTLKQAGIAVLNPVVPRNMEEYSALYREIASAFYGRELYPGEKGVEKSVQIGLDARKSLENAAKSVELNSFIYINGKFMAAGAETFENAVLSLSGENLCKSEGYVSADTLEGVSPEYVIADGSLSESGVTGNETIAAMVNNGAKLIYVDTRVFERPTARTANIFAELIVE